MCIKSQIQSFFHKDTNTFSYLVTDSATAKTAIIDPVLDYEPVSEKVDFIAVNELLKVVERENLNVVWISETHVYADHLSAAHYLKDKTGASVDIGKHIRDVQKIFSAIFNLDDLVLGGSAFDHRFKDGKMLTLGSWLLP